MNRNMERHLVHLAFEEGWETIHEKDASYEVMICEEETSCNVYVFAPSLDGECWTILIMDYTDAPAGQAPVSDELRFQIEWLADKIHAEIIQMKPA